jgi:solute carrier family 25 citrate transporter 1
LREHKHTLNLFTTMSASTSEISPVSATPALVVPQLPRRTQAAVSAPAQKKHTPSAGVSLFAGAVAGGVEATVTYPFEFAKTRAQLQGGGSGSRNPFAAIAQVARSDGVGAIYTGCSTLILGTAFKAGVRFLSFDAIRNRLVDERGVLSPGRGILAGMMAGAVESVAAVTPTERIKTKSGHRQFRGGFDATRSIMAAQGLPGLYRGLVSTTMKQSATSAVRMGSYNVLKEASKKNSLPQNSATTFAIGALAGTITVYATQPFDTIKTRAQSARGASTGEAFRSVLVQSGVRGFWSGSTMRLGRLVFSGGIVFTVYEKVAALMSRPS